MYPTLGIDMDDSNITDVSTPQDNSVISVGLLVPGLAIVVINIIVLLRGFTTIRQDPGAWLRLLGLSSCDLLGGVVAIVISVLAFNLVDAVTCKVVHILVPTVCCSQLYYLLAVLLYEDIVLSDTMRNMNYNNEYFLCLFVFVAWFMSLVSCSLPIVADGGAANSTLMCTPEAVFQQTWRQAMIYYSTIYFLPLLATNMLFVKHLMILRKFHAKESSPYVHSIEVVPSHSRDTFCTIQDGHSGQRSGSHSKQKTWESEVIKKWSSRMKARDLQRTAEHRDVHGTVPTGSSTPPTARHKRLIGKKGKDDRRLWKKLQETVFSQDWKQMGTFEERYRLANQPNLAQQHQPSQVYVQQHPPGETQKQQPSTYRQTTVIESRNSEVTQEDRDMRVPLSVLKRRHLTLSILLMILDVVSVFRLVVIVSTFNGDANLMRTQVITILSVTIGGILNGVVYALRWKICKYSFTSLYQTSREFCCKGYN